MLYFLHTAAPKAHRFRYAPNPARWILGLLLLMGGCSPREQHSRVSPTEHRVRVMTYNIHHGANADERTTLHDIADLIAANDADIVGLQEVDRHWSERSAFADQVQELSKQLDMRFAFGPVYDLPAEEEGHPRRQYGLAILSRYPIIESRNFELTRLTTITAEPELRRLPGFLMAKVDVDGRVLHVFNTHLDYRPDPAVRRTQVAEMLDIVARYGAPLVLMGDFNAPPEADELESLRNAFVDAWIQGRGINGHTYPSSEPTKRIDMLFVTPDVGVDTAVVPVSTASDHLPVFADLTLPRR